ncbi:hypothetical protein GMB67_06365 [Turicibacter sanguinis]|nr:hypothetical protein [Turicibacter sanguinis]
MNGNSIYTELMTYFEYNPDMSSPPALVQPRDKIKPEAFVQLFNDFIDTYDCLKLFRGFRQLAVDDSGLNIAHTSPIARPRHEVQLALAAALFENFVLLIDVCSMLLVMGELMIIFIAFYISAK